MLGGRCNSAAGLLLFVHPLLVFLIRQHLLQHLHQLNGPLNRCFYPLCNQVRFDCLIRHQPCLHTFSRALKSGGKTNHRIRPFNLLKKLLEIYVPESGGRGAYVDFTGFPRGSGCHASWRGVPSVSADCTGTGSPRPSVISCMILYARKII